jgi:hypothetical protein
MTVNGLAAARAFDDEQSEQAVKSPIGSGEDP